MLETHGKRREFWTYFHRASCRCRYALSMDIFANSGCELVRSRGSFAGYGGPSVANARYRSPTGDGRSPYGIQFALSRSAVDGTLYCSFIHYTVDDASTHSRATASLSIVAVTIVQRAYSRPAHRTPNPAFHSLYIFLLGTLLGPTIVRSIPS